MPTPRSDEPTQVITESEPSTVRLLGPALFGAWHRILASLAGFFVRLARAVVRIVQAWARQWVRVRDYHVGTMQTSSAETVRARETAVAVGLRAFIVGVALAGWAAADQKSAVMAGIATVLTELLWAGARFIIIAMVMPRGVIDRQRLSVAFFAGLLPYLFGMTAALRVVSLVASALLTRRGLLGAGVPKTEADRAIGWSFGGQLGVVAAGWLLRVLLALVVGL